MFGHSAYWIETNALFFFKHCSNCIALGLKHFNPNVFSRHYVVTVVQLIWKVGRLLSTPQKILTPLPSCLSKYSPWRQMLLDRISCLKQLGFVKGRAVCTVWHGYWLRFLFEKNVDMQHHSDCKPFNCTWEKQISIDTKLYSHNIKNDRPTVICRLKGIKRENNAECWTPVGQSFHLWYLCVTALSGSTGYVK